MKYRNIFLCLLLAGILLSAGSREAIADTVALHDGRVIEGRVEESGDIIKLHLNHGTITIPHSKIKKILVDADGKVGPVAKRERQRIAKLIEEMQKRSRWVNAYREETKHFVFNYNVTPEIARIYIDMLEGFYKDFGKELKVRLGPGVKRKKMQINIFRDKENFAQVGGVPGAAGFWNFVDERLFFYYDRNDPEFVQNVLLHEFTHLLTHLIAPKFCHPIWCNEGIAEYYGASKIKDGKLVFGCMQEGRLVNMNRWREKGNDYTLEELMRVPSGSFGALEYGWGWSLVHFFMNNKKYRKKFMKYYIDLARGRGIKREQGNYYYPTVRASNDVAHFKKVFGIKNFDKLNKEWHDYIDSALKVSSGSGYLYEGKRYYWENKYKEALEALEMAENKWTGDPSALLYHYKGLSLKNLDRFAEAEDALREALRLDPLNAWDYYYLGDIYEKKGGDDDCRKAAQNKKMAREIAPDDYNLRYRVERDEQKWKGDDRYGS
jgi:tetratricopeptide (TPR) repeat protein